jgi:hypothetical protein
MALEGASMIMIKEQQLSLLLELLLVRGYEVLGG